MSGDQQTNQTSVGTDIVVFENDSVIIHARRPMPLWEAREYQRQPVFYKGRKFYIRAKLRDDPPFACCIVLMPWPENLNEQSTEFFVYDEQFVRDRDRNFVSVHVHEAAHSWLLIFTPLMGFLWSGVKEKYLEQHGFVAQTVTELSLYLQFGLATLNGILFGYLGGGFVQILFGSEAFLFDLASVILLYLDFAVRYSQIMDHRPYPDGFLEWIIPRAHKNERRG